ncbi:MAG: FlgD immunoglobulin-like domain containing protein [candidate division WOR-3 bacterium]
MRICIQILLRAGAQNYCPSDIRIYDLSGKLVKTLSTSPQSLVNGHSLIWDGRDEANHRVAPGIYFLEYKTNSETQRLKLAVLE